MTDHLLANAIARRTVLVKQITKFNRKQLISRKAKKVAGRITKVTQF